MADPGADDVAFHRAVEGGGEGVAELVIGAEHLPERPAAAITVGRFEEAAVAAVGQSGHPAVFAPHAAEVEVGVVEDFEGLVGISEHVAQGAEQPLLGFGEGVRLFAQQFDETAAVEGEFGRIEEGVHRLLRNGHHLRFEPGAGVGERGEERLDPVDPGAVGVVGGVLIGAEVGEGVDLLAEPFEVVERGDGVAEDGGGFGQASAEGEEGLRERPDPVEILLPRFRGGVEDLKVPGLFF